MKTLNYLIVVLSFSFIFGACNSSSKLLETGQYDLAVTKSVAKIQKDRENQKNIDVLVKAYPKANDKNLEKIDFLQKEGRPDRWESIYFNYVELKRRQDLVKTVMPLKYNGRLLEFENRNYTDKLIEAKKNAANYFYSKGKSQMNEGRKLSYRNAYDNFQKAKKYNSNFADLNNLMDEAYNLGINKVVVSVVNQTKYRLPQDYNKQLLSLDFEGLEKSWNRYYTPLQQYSNSDYDYSVKIVLRNMTISPERVKENTITETKKVRDGWEYEYDARGNVKKDSIGNDIKKPKYKTIRCDIVESVQLKDIIVEAYIDVYRNSTRKLVKSYPVSAEGHFQSVARVARGDIAALSPETRKTLGGKPVPFPDDFQMMFDAIPAVKGQIMGVLNQAQNLYQ